MEEKLINIKVNGKDYRVAQGNTILRTCESLGIAIPSLCYLEGISEEGACALCLVEVKNMRTLTRACLTKVNEGMEIFTDTARVRSAQKINLELILAHHPLDCMTCDKNGNCLLQDLAYKFGIKKSRFLESDEICDKKEETPWSTNPFIEFYPHKCIVCARCANACKNQAVLEAITMVKRGHAEQVSTAFDMPLEKTNCQFCGECLQACPTSALMEKTRLGKGRLKDFTVTDTICAYCGVGCSLTMYTNEQNDIIVAAGKNEGSVNKGKTCVKGRFGHEYVSSPDRLKSPLIKDNGKFREASWEEAIQYTAKRLSEIKNKYGPDSIAVLGSSKCTNEDNYVVQKFARACIGTNNVDNCARLCHASTVVGLGKSFGAGAATNSCEDIKDSDVMFVIGSNMAESHPVIAQMVKAQKKNNGAKIIVCDPRYVNIAKYADIYLPHLPGSDVALLNGMMKVIIEKNLEDQAFINYHTEAYEELKKVVSGYDLHKVSQITGVSPELIEEAAVMYAKAKNAMIFYTMGITQHTTGVDNVQSLANLALLTGNIGKPGAGIMALRGQANVQGACDMGALPDVLPGYQKVADQAARGKFEAAWGVTLPDETGLCVTELATEALKGTLKAVYAMGENPLMTEPDIQHVKEGFEKLEFLAVQDIFLSATAELADVVFPATATYEKDGTFTNTERRVQLLRQVRRNPADTRFDWEIVCNIATAMGYPMAYQSTAQIMEEIASLTPSYAGINHGRLSKAGLQWPCPDSKHPGTLFLYKDGVFKRPNAKAIFTGIEYKAPKEIPDKEYPLVLTTGRILFHYHSGNETRRVKVLDQHVPRNYVEINAKDAARLSINNKDMVKVTSRRGSITLEARISEMPRAGVVFISFHFKEAAANVLTNPVYDALAKIPEYKVSACKIEKIK
ncbi:MAG: formate dehydrogenase subunit alpha [Candidatus Omnitrophica bacterium]|nr:formate dehydrogenase subunit alpha [Candidatus Omnitrophota bacterium]